MNSLANIFSDTTQAWHILLAISFIGGILASLSPCSLAMVPLIMGYVGGYSKESTLKIFVQLVFFIIGTAIVFATIGIFCAITGSVFATAFGKYFTLFISSILLVMGLKLINILDFEFPTIIKALPVNNHHSLISYPLLLGITFALAGTPCSTPILAGIMAFAAIGENILLAVLMLFLFAIGEGIILILVGIFTSSLKNIKQIGQYTGFLNKFSGLLLIFASIFLYWKVFSPLF